MYDKWIVEVMTSGQIEQVDYWSDDKVEIIVEVIIVGKFEGICWDKNKEDLKCPWRTKSSSPCEVS